MATVQLYCKSIKRKVHLNNKTRFGKVLWQYTYFVDLLHMFVPTNYIIPLM